MKTVYTDLISSAAMAEPWLILDHAYAALWSRALNFDPKSMGPGNGEDDDDVPRYEVGNDGVALLSIKGPIMRDPESWEKRYYGVRAQEDIASELDRAAADPMVRSLLLDIDSPGGHAIGSHELAMKVRQIADSIKPVVSRTGGYIASAAFHFASQSSALIATPSANVGCIGTIISWLDVSAWYEQLGVKREVIVNEGATFKGMGLPGTSLTKEQRAFLQEQITKMGESFKADVRARRNCADDAMRGQCLFGEDALKAKLVDALGDMNYARRTAQQLAAIRGSR